MPQVQHQTTDRIGGTPAVPGYNQALPEQNMTVNGSQTFNFTFTGVPTPGFGGYLKVYAKGDIDGSGENISVSGEGGTQIGTAFDATGQATQCSNTLNAV